jgi:hypothetical protein
MSSDLNFFEDGNENKFVHIDTIELNGNEYVVLVQYTEELPEIEDNEEEEEVVILKVEHGDNGEDSFVTIEDEEELGVVFQEFCNRMDEDYYEDDED